MHTVLIADDDFISLEVLKAMLEAFPLDLLVANNGQEALDLCLAHEPELLILDYDMPDITGAEVLLQFFLHFLHLPEVLTLTFRGGGEYRARA